MLQTANAVGGERKANFLEGKRICGSAKCFIAFINCGLQRENDRLRGGQIILRQCKMSYNLYQLRFAARQWPNLWRASKFAAVRSAEFAESKAIFGSENCRFCSYKLQLRVTVFNVDMAINQK